MKRITVDEENNAEQWWESLDTRLESQSLRSTVPDCLRSLRESGAYEIDVSDTEADRAITWASQLDGWATGPRHARNPLVVNDA